VDGKGLNFSKILENALKEYLRRLNDSEKKKNSELEVLEPRAGFEPLVLVPSHSFTVLFFMRGHRLNIMAVD
jgi:hypothetical protein